MKTEIIKTEKKNFVPKVGEFYKVEGGHGVFMRINNEDGEKVFRGKYFLYSVCINDGEICHGEEYADRVQLISDTTNGTLIFREV